MRSWCLWQICTCRRHHCPHGTPRIYENSGVFCPTTEYLEKYPVYDSVLPPQSLKPKQEIRACCDKMEEITTFKSDYCPYEINSLAMCQKSINQNKGRLILVLPINGILIHKRPLERQQVKKGKLDTVPTYKG
ncbi:stabilizer of axonemal microtubules 1-like isoform X2 [Sapajus apella]|nr:stabilizer of axonemal microtubules 1-like isoform X2 [Sapajus apella]